MHCPFPCDEIVVRRPGSECLAAASVRLFEFDGRIFTPTVATLEEAAVNSAPFQPLRSAVRRDDG